VAIKRITAANENRASGRSREQAQEYWAEVHGKLVANRASLLRYHHYFSLPEAYEGSPRPTFIGISMFWNDDPLAPSHPWPNDWSPVGPDDRQLFDREPRWPRDGQHADVLGEEHVILDGDTTPSMVNAIFMVNRLGGLDHRDFFEHWLGAHAELAARLPGLRRYVQSHAVLGAFARGRQTHDGWSELWFDDYESFQMASRSNQWQAMEDDGRTLFANGKGIVIGREYVQKDENWKPRDYGALSLNEEQIRERLLREGYKTLVTTVPDAPARIKLAATKNQLGVWTPEHLVTLDESRIDARPDH
jgi:uncharacterized protein (TIGR02118 family)